MLVKLQWCLFFIFLGASFSDERIITKKRSFSDQSVVGYLTERTCWWNEICKEEFQTQFRCRCPNWSFCRSPGRYYNAFCSMTRTGYIWMQPEKEWSVTS
ncbi:Sulfotransferase 3 [Carabus blaptoides fortunei]